MLHIVLLVLKIIGIILLCILGILLLGIVCVLFVPVRYKIELDREEGEGKPPSVVRAKITWFLHLLNILIRYPAEVSVRVRILFFTIFRIPKKSKHSKAPEQDTTKDTQTDNQTHVKESAISEEQISAKDLPQTEAPIPESEPLQTEEAIPDTPSQAKEQTSVAEPLQPDKQDSLKEKCHKILEKIKNFIRKIKELFQNIQYTIEHFCDRIKSISNQIEYYKGIITSDIFQQSFQLCKGELFSIMKSLKPQKFKADVIVGMDDPATTAQILAIWGMLYPIIGEHVNVAGDFEQNRIEGHVLIKGKIKVFTFVRAVIRIYFNKDSRKLIQLLKKEAV